MIRIADLHTHSKASDGQFCPSEVVRMAKDSGIEVLALTDHDTISGLDEAIDAGREYGVQILPGVELSAREYHTFHILGYGFDPKNSILAETLSSMRQGRNSKALRIIDYLKDSGVHIEFPEVQVLSGNGVIGRPHFARLLLEKGYISNYRDAFDLYLDTDEYHEQVETEKPSVVKCIEWIKSSGGKVSLAHPYQIGISDEEMSRLVRDLTDLGLDAIECYYPKQTPEMTFFYVSLAKKYGLHITGGSDFHGEKVKPGITLSRWELELDWLVNG